MFEHNGINLLSLLTLKFALGATLFQIYRMLFWTIMFINTELLCS